MTLHEAFIESNEKKAVRANLASFYADAYRFTSSLTPAQARSLLFTLCGLYNDVSIATVHERADFGACIARAIAEAYEDQAENVVLEKDNEQG